MAVLFFLGGGAVQSLYSRHSFGTVAGTQPTVPTPFKTFFPKRNAQDGARRSEDETVSGLPWGFFSEATIHARFERVLRKPV